MLYTLCTLFLFNLCMISFHTNKNVLSMKISELQGEQGHKSLEWIEPIQAFSRKTLVHQLGLPSFKLGFGDVLEMGSCPFSMFFAVFLIALHLHHVIITTLHQQNKENQELQSSLSLPELDFSVKTHLQKFNCIKVRIIFIKFLKSPNFTYYARQDINVKYKWTDVVRHTTISL